MRAFRFGALCACGGAAAVVAALLLCGGPIGLATMRLGARIASAGGAQPFVDAGEADAIIRALAEQHVTEVALKLLPAKASVAVVKR